jgi:hypothetical protein
VVDLVRQVALHQHVAREELALRVDLAAAAHLDDLLGRDQHLVELVGQTAQLRLVLDRLRHLVLEVRVRVDDVPPLRHRDRP